MDVCPLVPYHIMLGKKWHDDYSVPKHFCTNVISVRKKQRTINISATLTIPSAIWSKHKLARQLKRRNTEFTVFLLPM